MSFDTVTFWAFFAVAWSTWRYLPFGAAKTTALGLSLLFYAWWNPWFLILIAASAIIDYRIGARLHASQDPRARKTLLLASLICNLGLLAVFKYAPFAASNASVLARWIGYDVDLSLPGWIIPVGISFYTFQTLSYSIDIYRKQLEPAESFRDFFLFVAFFPQLVAGPIVRANQLLPQFRARRTLLPAAVQAGLYHVVLGLFLKIVVADNLAHQVERVFDARRAAHLAPMEAWLGVIYFGVQIFADFAGYSGIAIGLAYLMGLRFPENFRCPYISSGLSEFWSRWHITLSEWLRDYLYIPLGGNRGSAARTSVNLMLTMLLGGLWHGASWTFVAWGGLHGLGLVVERALGGKRRARGAATRPSGPLDLAARLARIALVYVFVHVAWVFFRAGSFGLAWTLLGRMFVAPFREPVGWEVLADARYLILVAPVAGMHLWQLLSEWFKFERRVYLRAAMTGLAVVLLVVFKRGLTVDFLYFQF